MNHAEQVRYAGPSPLEESGYRTGLHWNTNSRACARAADMSPWVEGTTTPRVLLSGAKVGRVLTECFNYVRDPEAVSR
ncbi:hypothetical protein [Streptomyces sp. PSKA30]|uniref:hypothetical protein n=1 Tax=Streptomyces sp. PSKA30 TaxID=2874597 RepID=UPI001CD100C4|nr:hypothetical protein [Streptomyces sp. PSKA30]MBZ9645215.1 hypothetical protein [Streptomyces sp. PSKA30]